MSEIPLLTDPIRRSMAFQPVGSSSARLGAVGRRTSTSAFSSRSTGRGHPRRGGGDYPLDRRRLTPAEERALLGFSADGLGLGMGVCRQLAMERPPRPWPEQILPYRLATRMRVTPSGWTLTEASFEVRLPGPRQAS